MGVIIAPRTKMANLTMGGAATFEQVVNDVTSSHPKTNPFPLYAIGLEFDGATVIDMSQSRFASADSLSGMSAKGPIHHAVSAIRAGIPPCDIGMPGLETNEAADSRRAKVKAKPQSLQTSFF